jgi:hypothetical protein
MKAGDIIHINADTKDWGRVASDGLVVAVYSNQFIQVYANSILATVTVRKAEVSPIQNPVEDFAERINPTNLGFSPKMTALIRAIIGHDYGVRDGRGGTLTSLSITSDGFVICGSTASDGGGAFIGSASDLDRNLADYRFQLAAENDEDAEEFDRLYVANVKDWRNY